MEPNQIIIPKNTWKDCSGGHKVHRTVRLYEGRCQRCAEAFARKSLQDGLKSVPISIAQALLDALESERKNSADWAKEAQNTPTYEEGYREGRTFERGDW